MAVTDHAVNLVNLEEKEISMERTKAKREVYRLEVHDFSIRFSQ